MAFLGNVDVGRDVEVKELLARYDAVILAYGAGSGTVCVLCVYCVCTVCVLCVYCV